MSYDISDKNTKYFAVDDEKAMKWCITKHEAFGYTVTKTYLQDRNIYCVHWDIDDSLEINQQILELERLYDEGEAAINYMDAYIDSPPNKKQIRNALKPSKFVWILAISTFVLSLLFLILAFSMYSGALTAEMLMEHVSVSIPEGSPITEADLTSSFFATIFLSIGLVFLSILCASIFQIIMCYKEINITYLSEKERYDENCEYYEKRIAEIEDDLDSFFDTADDLSLSRDN